MTPSPRLSLWDRFRMTVAEAEALARLGGVRRAPDAGASTILASGAGHLRVPRCIHLPERASGGTTHACYRPAARQKTVRPRPASPGSIPTSFIRERWARHVFPGGVIDRRYYELCVLSELRDRLRAGDVWVVGSADDTVRSRNGLSPARRCGSWNKAACCRIAVDADFDRFIGALPRSPRRTADGDRHQGEGRLRCPMSRSTRAC